MILIIFPSSFFFFKLKHEITLIIKTGRVAVNNNMAPRHEYDIITCEGTTLTTSSIFLSKVGYFRRLMETDCEENITGRIHVKQRMDAFRLIHDMLVYDTHLILDDFQYSKDVNRASLKLNMKYFQFDSEYIDTVENWEPVGNCPCVAYVKMKAIQEIRKNLTPMLTAETAISLFPDPEIAADILLKTNKGLQACMIACSDNNIALFEKLLAKGVLSQGDKCQWRDLVAKCINMGGSIRENMLMKLVSKQPFLVKQTHAHLACRKRDGLKAVQCVFETGRCKVHLSMLLEAIEKKKFDLFSYLMSVLNEKPSPALVKPILEVEDKTTTNQLLQLLFDAGLDASSPEFEEELSGAGIYCTMFCIES